MGNHCDFMPLRNLVLAHHMQDLKEVTHSRHYENFRRMKLQQMMSNLGSKEELGRGLGGQVGKDGDSSEDIESELESQFSARLGRRVSGLSWGRHWGREPRPGTGHTLPTHHTPYNTSQEKGWSGCGTDSMTDLKHKSLDSILSGRKMKNLVSTLNSRVRGQ